MSSSAAATIITPLPAFSPPLQHRAWSSTPHPTLPLLATAHSKSATIYSLTTLSSHSTLTGGHTRSVRCLAWKPNLPAGKLCIVSGSFDSTAGLWRWDDEADPSFSDDDGPLEREITAAGGRRPVNGGEEEDAQEKEWEFTLVLEGHDSELKSATFSPSGLYLATCSRDKSIWIWEDIGPTEASDEWETIAVLTEHEGDVKAVAWCPDVPGRNARKGSVFGSDCLASASYDDTARVWREDSDGEWVSVAVLEGHEGTVWGVEWEGRKDRPSFPRLMTHSADGTIRVWTLSEGPDDDDDAVGGGQLGGIPNRMRRTIKEDWRCTDILPRVHDKDIYSISWNKESGIVASTGSDGVIALYREEDEAGATTEGGDAMEPAAANGTTTPTTSSSRWKVLATVKNAHGPFEVNHITWCKRFDGACERKGQEDMLVTTGDDGTVKPWQVLIA